MDAAAAVRVGEKGACAEVIDGVDLRAEVEAESSCRRAATKLAQQSGAASAASSFEPSFSSCLLPAKELL